MKFEIENNDERSRWGESSGVLVFDVVPKLKKAYFLKLI